jgi:5'-3' exonuclease
MIYRVRHLIISNKMGIPSYFSYIIRNHMKVLKPFLNFKQDNVVHNFYMDCNSVIYDCIRELEKGSGLKPRKSDNYHKISSMVCARIQLYIDNVQPSNVVFIAFDGVAPMAKMCQQRVRRYKSAFTENILSGTNGSSFNSCHITPGTDFMNYLSDYVSKHFDKTNKVIVSSANEPGEGEHKLFQYIRANPAAHSGKNTIIYGLDADLLMLSIFHTEQSNLFVYREAPEFAKSLNADLKSGEPYVLNIKELCISIASEMDCTHSSPNRVFDYAFLCFMLGNDFLPHFPAINIRTTGIYSLLDTYKLCLGSRNEYLVDVKQGTINWQNFKKIVQNLRGSEETLLRNEYLKRGDIKLHPNKTGILDEATFNNAPLLFRQKEHYINPVEHGWQQRYYKALFECGSDDAQLHAKVSYNYLEGLEWVFRYYTDKCVNWHWKYEYHYPPLLEDLAHAVGKPVCVDAKNGPLHPHTQLCFVLPPKYLRDILPAFPIEKYAKYYDSEYEFEWAFCRYFWEAHLVLEEEMPLYELLKIDTEHHTGVKNK